MKLPQFHTTKRIFYTNKAHYSLIFKSNSLYLPKNSASEQQRIESGYPNYEKSRGPVISHG